MAALNFTAGPAPRRYQRRARTAAEEADRARSALQAIDPGCSRAEWLRVAIAAKAAGLDEQDFVRWSEGAPNFDSERDCLTAWRKPAPGGAVTAATLFGMARDAGWRDDAQGWRAEPPRRPQEPRTAPAKPERQPFDVAGTWAACEPATAAHGYIQRKLGLHDGLRVVPADSRLHVGGEAVAGWLAVPLFGGGAGDEPASLQFIRPDKSGDPARDKRTAPGPMRGWLTVGPKPTPGTTVYVVEGIGQAWSAHQSSRAPAAVAFGAGRMESVARELLERVPGVRVVLVADVGQEAKAEAIARGLGCAWVAPPADLGSNGDINDLHQRDGLQAVAELLAQAQEPAKPEPRFRLLTADELAELPPVRWRVRGVLPAEGLAAIYGAPGSGKSFLGLDLLGAVAEGRDWFGYRTNPAPVVYVALEGEAGMAQRLQAYRSRHGQAPAGMRFIAQPFALLEPADVAELAEVIQAAGGAGGIVAIDTLNRASPGADENDSRDMGHIIAGAKLLQAALGGLVLLVHHSGKANAKEKALDQYAGRGGSALSDGCRMVAVMQPLDAAEWLKETGSPLGAGETGLVMALPKLSYCKPQDPIFIRREGYRFSTVSVIRRTPAQDAAALTEQVLQFITNEFRQGRRYAARDLDAVAKETFDVSRERLRLVLTGLKVAGRIVYHEVKGKAGSHFEPVSLADAGRDTYGEGAHEDADASREKYPRGPIGMEDGGDTCRPSISSSPELCGEISATPRDTRDTQHAGAALSGVGADDEVEFL